ncbi:UvrABC system protein A [Methanimicrococcus hongohii]|uniref:UvrABC system protein A n=1 Tax=Methanimicrococcus hongohii TaxID=3028295 RepID=A0AA96V124_9EURY|nr:excinuclease ABC subunit UvrA [Methanimicrococcus sp. Hf6]WNY23043.1 UvrABC system protein A [Methanimicrococcus sp. Hf6]
MNKLIIKGAREHNLKNISVTIPKNQLTVITGVSGSGKSTLAFDTIYAEGQRRYVESLSSYARQFLGIMDKPDVDSIEGLSPAISIEQKTTSKNPRSTVGTVTEIYDYFRLLFARIGTPYCPDHNLKIESQSPEKIADLVFAEFEGQVTILAPIIRKKKGTYQQLIRDLNTEGFTRVRVNGEIYRTDEEIELERYKMHDIDIVIDRIDVDDENERSRLVEACERATERSGGLVYVFGKPNSYRKEKGTRGLSQKILKKRSELDDDSFEDSEADADEIIEVTYSSKMACPECGLAYEELQPRMFSFNSPFGACAECNGLGFKMEFDENLIIPDRSLSIAEGAVAVYRNYFDGYRQQHLASVAKHYGFSALTPIKDLTEEQYNALMYGSDDKIKFNMKMNNGEFNYTSTNKWEGVLPQCIRLYSQTESDYRRQEFEKFMRVSKCPTCEGDRLSKKALSVKIDGYNIIDITKLSVDDAIDFFDNMPLTEKQEEIAHLILKEIQTRLHFLSQVGIGYLTMFRNSGTLSGGEAQRIRLATQIGSNLTGVLYVLDEPSIGLHQRDNNKLIETLRHLRDLGNTLVVVEHDEDTILNADYVIDMGPGAGVAGGHVVSAGTPDEILNDSESLTGRYLSGTEFIPIPTDRRTSDAFIRLKGAKAHNLKNLSVDIPTGVLTAVTGVSGSGKSTLIYDTLYPALMHIFYHSKMEGGEYSSLQFDTKVDKVIVIDQDPIGKTPRSNPATYTKIFDKIREIYASTKEAKVRGYAAGRFSFNVKGGRCEACQGDGMIKIEMNFLPDVYVECEECKGTRYNKETLEVKYNGKSIAEVLNMTVAEALEHFQKVPYIHDKLDTLARVGLDYIKLGQSSTTLSGGEAQRIKLTRELSKKATGKTIYLLDEPTTGLHFHDVKKLISVLNDLVEMGNTVIVIEHNLDVIKCADYIIDMGPEGGNDGGEIVSKGTPEDVIKSKKSYTAQYLKPVLEKAVRIPRTTLKEEYEEEKRNISKGKTSKTTASKTTAAKTTASKTQTKTTDAKTAVSKTTSTTSKAAASKKA